MPGTSTFEYVVADPVIAQSRIGTVQVLDFLASSHDVPFPKADARRQVSRRGGVVATTVFGEWREGTVECPYITEAELPQWIEFLMSIRLGDPFTIRVSGGFPGFIDIRTSNLRVITTAEQLELPRYRGDSCTAYTCAVPWREVKEL